MSEKIDITPEQDGGVLKEILTPAPEESPMPSVGDTVNVHYVGTLESGEKFDSSIDRDEQFSFELGAGNVIKSWDIGIATMKVNEKARFTCRSDYAYGDAGSPPKIPGGATLIFEVELFSFKHEPNTPAEKIEAATKAKSEGNAIYKSAKSKDDYERAKVKYEEGLDYVEFLYGAGDEDSASANALKFSFYLNLASTEIALGNYQKAIERGNSAIETNGDSSKAHYRVSTAYLADSDFDNATKYVDSGIELAKSNNENIKPFTVLAQKVKRGRISYQKKSKNIYSSMFKKMAEANDKEAEDKAVEAAKAEATSEPKVDSDEKKE